MINQYVKGIAVNTLRSLYLCPIKGGLVMMNKRIKQTATGKVGIQPVGISYGEYHDVDVVSDCEPHRIYVLSAVNHHVINKCGCFGHRNNQFAFPANIHVGHLHGHRSPLIVVSDSQNNRITVHTMNGQHIKTFGNKNSPGDQLSSP